MEEAIAQITEIVNRETEAWDTQNVHQLLTVFQKDMVWPWPEKSTDHDPATWKMVLGRFNYQRWRLFYQDFFAKHKLVHNKREIKKIVVSDQEDGAVAIVDIDTLWETRENGEKNHWKGRTCKVYSKIGDEWKMIMHTGVLEY
jgi:ketosteroid isomerase-like protein